MMNNKKYLNDKKPASLLPMCAVLGVLGFRIVQIYKFGIPCRFWQSTGIYCPGCGGTRALLALLDGNLRLSVHENPAVFLLIIFGILYSLEKILKFRNRSVKLLPKNPIFWEILIALWIIWDIFRNLIPEMMPYT